MHLALVSGYTHSHTYTTHTHTAVTHHSSLLTHCQLTALIIPAFHYHRTGSTDQLTHSLTDQPASGIDTMNVSITVLPTRLPPCSPHLAPLLSLRLLLLRRCPSHATHRYHSHQLHSHSSHSLTQLKAAALTQRMTASLSCHTALRNSSDRHQLTLFYSLVPTLYADRRRFILLP